MANNGKEFIKAVRLDRPSVTGIARIMKANDWTASQVIRLAVREYLERKHKKEKRHGK